MYNLRDLIDDIFNIFAHNSTTLSNMCLESLFELILEVFKILCKIEGLYFTLIGKIGNKIETKLQVVEDKIFRNWLLVDEKVHFDAWRYNKTNISIWISIISDVLNWWSNLDFDT